MEERVLALADRTWLACSAAGPKSITMHSGPANEFAGPTAARPHLGALLQLQVLSSDSTTRAGTWSGPRALQGSHGHPRPHLQAPWSSAVTRSWSAGEGGGGVHTDPAWGLSLELGLWPSRQSLAGSGSLACAAAGGLNCRAFRSGCSGSHAELQKSPVQFRLSATLPRAELGDTPAAPLHSPAFLCDSLYI